MQKVSCCVQGPGETSETWTYPSMVLVPLCTAMVMAWPLQGELRFPWQPSIAIPYDPPLRSES